MDEPRASHNRKAVRRGLEKFARETCAEFDSKDAPRPVS